MTAPVPLPSPRRERWQPLRSGVLNLYRYDYEEFHFADGRLLLRGNNGSGKSRVLALQLPFLLDGEVSPARIEPDGDAAKRIEWNLLMGRHPDRTGYTWIEFGRRDAAGIEHFLTLGCGLRAVAGHTGLHSRWFFTTTRRIGRDLFLQNHQRTPLSRERLAEALGAGGHVYQKAEEYRHAVDAALFGLGPRYGALLELLIRLRRPQLTRKLDENELPEALSEALATLPPAIVEEVAESFRSLQADKDTVRGFQAARDAVANFLREYTGYIRIAVRRRAEVVRRTHSAYEHAGREARDATTRLEAAAHTLASLTTRLSELQVQLATAETEERTLAASPEMRTADEIRLAGEAASAAEKALATARTDEADATHRAEQAQARQRQAEEQSAGIEQECHRQLQRADSAAAAAELSIGHRAQLPLEPAFSLAPNAESLLNQELSQRTRHLKHLRAGEKSVNEAAARLRAAEHALQEAESAATAARDDEHSARETLATQGARLLSAHLTWQQSVRLLTPATPVDLESALADWLDRRTGPSPIRAIAESAHQQAVTRFATREAALTREASDLANRTREIEAAILRLEQGEIAPPPPPPTRRLDRTALPGSPLWRVCDFHPALAEADRTGLEAALQASGLLDAWLLPDGRLIDPANEDTFLHSADLPPVPYSLGRWLVPAIDPADVQASQLTPETVARTLAAIGGQPPSATDAPAPLAWVATDGSWRLGPLAGRWSKPAADYIGESTRASTRRRQLESLRAELVEIRSAQARRQSATAALAADRDTAAAEYVAAPAEEPVLRAGYALEAATRRVADAMAATERAAQTATLLRTEWTRHHIMLQQDAADLKLAPWLGRLDELDEASRHYATLLASLWPTFRHRDSLAGQLAAAREQSAAATSSLNERRHRCEEAATAAAAARSRFQTLQETHGQTVTAVLARYTAAKNAVEKIKQSIATNTADQITQTAAHSTAQARQQSAEEKRQTQDALRRDAIANLRQLAEQRLLAEAAPAIDVEVDAEPWSVKHAVELARALDAALASTSADTADWQRHQDQIHSHIQELRDRLVPQGHQPETHQLDEIVLVRAVFQTRPHTMTELQAALADEIEAREQLLQAREREIIENHLLAEAAVELQKLIRAAETWRASANEELHARPTSTGVRFRFQWEPDPGIRFHEIRPILLRQGELWTPTERTAVATFLQGRIAAEQSAEESGSWKDHLSRALDYRRWHRFVIERQQEGQWRRLNKLTYGTGSGGEKALALTLPRFAAAAAHYRGAAPTAPRLVMLDEAFAGIDPTMRAQCLGVLAQFDLDVVMTSELEWGCYSTVPALAIYHLTTLPGLDAVAATRWHWNGREKNQIDHPEPVTRPPAPAESPPPDDLLSGSPAV